MCLKECQFLAFWVQAVYDSVLSEEKINTPYTNKRRLINK
jgi:hypothetical protein